MGFVIDCISDCCDWSGDEVEQAVCREICMPRYSVCVLYGGCRLAITRLYTLLYSMCLLVPHKDVGDSMQG